MFIYKITSVCVLLISVKAAFEGEQCAKGGVSGTCVNIRNCPSAIEDIKRRKNPQICGFSGSDPIVCCVDNAQVTNAPPPMVATPARPSATTEPYVPPVYDYHDNSGGSGGCDPLPFTRTSPKTGQKAWDKCIEYQEQLVYPCVKGVALTGDMTRVDRCGHNRDELIIGGVDAAKKEFPHMVLLGYGDTSASAQWLCGGSLISERFVLTAGHCTTSREAGAVTFVLIGALKRSEQVDGTRVYKTKRVVRHPEYKPPSKYNDIALLETEIPMQLDQFTVPACVDVGGNLNEDKAVATGWGATEYRGSSADNLQKVTLTKFTRDECSAKFPSNRNMVQGFDESTQTCFGDKTMSKDTCQGDSGGPLQIKNRKIECMYTIVGITSFGKACGWVGDPGIYTKVAAYVPWIESVVWP